MKNMLLKKNGRIGLCQKLTAAEISWLSRDWRWNPGLYGWGWKIKRRPCCGTCNPKGKWEEKWYGAPGAGDTTVGRQAWMSAEGRHQQGQAGLLCAGWESP